MPRRSHQPDRRRKLSRPDADQDPPVGAVTWQRSQSTPDGEFLVRAVPGAVAVKSYRCPGCQQVIQPGTAHLVVWPAWIGDEEGGVAHRRHWHTQCWQRRAAGSGSGKLVW